MARWTTNLITGIKRHPKKFLLALAFGYTTLWAVLEPLFTLMDVKTQGYNWYYLTVYILISLILALIVVYPKKVVRFDLKNTNTKVEIMFGDLFALSGHKVVSVDEYFDSKIGKPRITGNSIGTLEKIRQEVRRNSIENQMKKLMNLFMEKNALNSNEEVYNHPRIQSSLIEFIYENLRQTETITKNEVNDFVIGEMLPF